MIVGALMIVWAAGSHLRAFLKTRRPRYLVTVIVTLPVAILLVTIAFGRS